MTEKTDYDDMDPDEAMEELHRRIRTEGAAKAYKALLAVCEDAKSPAPARATAGVAILRASGAFERAADGGKQSLDDMSTEDLRAIERKLSRELEAMQRGNGQAPEPNKSAAGPKPKKRARGETTNAPPKRKKASGLFD